MEWHEFLGEEEVEEGVHDKEAFLGEKTGEGVVVVVVVGEVKNQNPWKKQHLVKQEEWTNLSLVFQLVVVLG